MAHFKCSQPRKSILIWIAFLVPFPVLAIISDNGVMISIHISFLLLIFSSIFVFVFSKNEPKTLNMDEQVEDRALSFNTAVKPPLSEAEQISEVPETTVDSSNLTALQSTPRVQQVVGEENHETGEDQFNVYSVRSYDRPSPKTVFFSDATQNLYSESESNDHSFSSEDSDVDCKMDQSQDCSDDSISDEESLIEIAIPSGHYLCTEEEEKKDHPKFSLQYKPQDFSAETMFKQHSFMDLLAEISEMNEEDNLIEIDISVGSIKCSRFEIEASS